MSVKFDVKNLEQILFDHKLDSIRSFGRTQKGPFFVVLALEGKCTGYLRRPGGTGGPLFTNNPGALTIFPCAAEAERVAAKYLKGNEGASVLIRECRIADVFAKAKIDKKAMAATEKMLDDADPSSAVAGCRMEAMRAAFPSRRTAYVVIVAKAGETKWAYADSTAGVRIRLTDDPAQAHVFPSRKSADYTAEKFAIWLGPGVAAAVKEIDVESILKADRERAAAEKRPTRTLEEMDAVHAVREARATWLRTLRKKYSEMFVVTVLNRDGEPGYIQSYKGYGRFTSDPGSAQMFYSLEEAKSAALKYYDRDLDCVKVVIRNIPVVLRKKDPEFEKAGLEAIRQHDVCRQLAVKNRRGIEELAGQYKYAFIVAVARRGDPVDVGYVHVKCMDTVFTHDITEAQCFISDDDAKEKALEYARMNPDSVIAIVRASVGNLLKKNA